MAKDFLRAEAEKHKDLAERYKTFEMLYEGKLYQQLTVELKDFVLDKANWRNNENNLVLLYSNFISTFQDNLSLLRVIQILSVVSQQHVANQDIGAAIDLMESAIKEDMEPVNLIVAKMSIAELHLLNKNQEECEEILENVEKKHLHLIYGSGDSRVASSAFYRVCTAYYKLVGPAEKFYDSAIQFLGYTPLEVIDEQKRVSLARDICFAALVGTDVFNFGEILPQPILKVLDNGEDAWLLRLLECFHEGDIETFAQIFESHEKMFLEFKILSSNIEILRQKIGIMSLLRLIFERPSEERTIPIDEIAERVKIESKMAEWLVMKAMAKGLITGKIDGVKRTVAIDWLKPRVLTRDQLGTMEGKLQNWKQRVVSTSQILQEETVGL